MSEQTRTALDIVWEFIAFLLTALAFLLVGLAISLGDLIDATPSIVWGVLAILVGRAVVVYGLLGGAARLFRRPASTEALSTTGGMRRLPRVPRGWLHVLFWAGLRGAVAVAMALSLPANFPERALLQQTAFGVVLFTLFTQGTTAELVVRRAVPTRP